MQFHEDIFPFKPETMKSCMHPLPAHLYLPSDEVVVEREVGQDVTDMNEEVDTTCPEHSTPQPSSAGISPSTLNRCVPSHDDPTEMGRPQRIVRPPAWHKDYKVNFCELGKEQHIDNKTSLIVCEEFHCFLSLVTSTQTPHHSKRLCTINIGYMP